MVSNHCNEIVIHKQYFKSPNNAQIKTPQPYNSSWSEWSCDDLPLISVVVGILCMKTDGPSMQYILLPTM